MLPPSDGMTSRPLPDAPPPYTHAPLTNADENLEICLIKLERVSANDDEPVRCEIEIFDLHSAPPYSALSYMWGPLTPTHKILMDGKWLEIRENLFHFLLEYRKHDMTSPNVSPLFGLINSSTGSLPTSPYDYSAVYFCIDQISIYQSNPPETNAEVQRMGDIYTRAERVIVWLGDGSDMCHGYSYRRKHHMRFKSYIYPTQSYYSVAQQFSASPDAIALVALMHHDYFSRLRIVQEILLAQEITVLIKDINISWRAIQHQFDCLLEDPTSLIRGLGASTPQMNFSCRKSRAVV
jgi:hypothetical protein